MKALNTLILLTLISLPAAFGQLTIDRCQEKARQNYPQIKQFGLIEKSAEYNLSNANKAYLPQLTLSAKATRQSDAISMDLTLPNGPSISIHQPKDQYQAVLEVNQMLWDGGVTSSQKKMVKASAEVEKQKLEVDLYTIKDRVNQLYFGILLLTQQLEQNATLNNELQTNLERVKACMQNGVANQADLDAIRVEILNNAQRRSELESFKKSYLEMLSAMTGETITESASLEKPVLASVSQQLPLNRPELKLFDSQLNLLDQQSLFTKTALFPKVGLFLQGGYGRPGLNMLSDDLSSFYIGGVRFSWNISSFYTQKNNLENIRLNKEMVATQKETFLFNNQLKIDQQNNEIVKARELLKNDDEIIRLRENIKKACASKVEKGVQTVPDLLREINAENLARQQRALHEVQLMMAVYNLQYYTNN